MGHNMRHHHADSLPRMAEDCIQQELEVIQMDRKKAIVTGGAIGMGRGIALVLAEDSSMAASYKGW